MIFLFDRYEYQFIKSNSQLRKFNKKDFIIIQCVEDYYFLLLYKEIIQIEKKSVIGYITIPLTASLLDYLLIIPLILKVLNNQFRKYKWKKLYNSIGVNTFVNPSDFFLGSFFRNIFKIFKYYNRIKTKNNLIDLKINDLKIGDLLYDTIVRFNRKTPTVNLKGFLYLKFLTLTLENIRFNDLLLKRYNFSKCFFSQGVYTYHGIPVRQFIENNKHVFTLGGLIQTFKRNTKEHFLMEKDFRYHKKNFEDNFSKKEIEIAKKQFSKRFRGLNDNGQVDFFDINPYGDSKIKINKSLDGVLFLHDFYDSSKIMGKSIFNDFLEWFEFTALIIRKYKLNIGIKPHPHDLTIESKSFVEKIIKDNSDLFWIDKTISNNILFNSGINFGITHHGTVASELAYFGIVPITCGENPTSSFNFTIQAKSRNDYEKILSKISKINFKIDKNEVFKFYYMHYMKKVDDYGKMSEDIKQKFDQIDRYKHESKKLIDFISI